MTFNHRKSLLFNYLQIAWKNCIRISNYLDSYFNTGNYRRINVIQSKVELKAQTINKVIQEGPPKFSIFKFHIDNILASVELKAITKKKKKKKTDRNEVKT